MFLGYDGVEKLLDEGGNQVGEVMSSGGTVNLRDKKGLPSAEVVDSEDLAPLFKVIYMTQPLVELYGGCMVVLTVS
jgi:hypothetical protein